MHSGKNLFNQKSRLPRINAAISKNFLLKNQGRTIPLST
jgi:hypothetical protein